MKKKITFEASLYSELEKKIQLFSFLERAKIQFGVFEEDGNLQQKVTIFNLDGTHCEKNIKVADIMYLTEKGTLTLPARPILNTISRKITYRYKYVIDEISKGIFEEEWNKSDIKEKIKEFEQEINDVIIPEAIMEIISSNNVISGLLDREKETKYLYNLNNLKKFIKCKIFF